MAERDEFLSRWSRRKLEASRGLRRKEQAEATRPGAEEAPDDAAKTAARHRGPVAGQASGANAPPAIDEAKAATDLDNVDFDKLDYESDYTRFLGEDVSPLIQRQALRKLWASNPIFSTPDGLDDYYCTADFTDAARAVPNVATSYRVGKGYFSDEELAAREEADKVASEPDSEGAAAAPEAMIKDVGGGEETEIRTPQSASGGEPGRTAETGTGKPADQEEAG